MHQKKLESFKTQFVFRLNESFYRKMIFICQLLCENFKIECKLKVYEEIMFCIPSVYVTWGRPAVLFVARRLNQALRGGTSMRNCAWLTSSRCNRLVAEAGYEFACSQSESAITWALAQNRDGLGWRYLFLKGAMLSSGCCEVLVGQNIIWFWP